MLYRRKRGRCIPNNIHSGQGQGERAPSTSHLHLRGLDSPCCVCAWPAPGGDALAALRQTADRSRWRTAHVRQKGTGTDSATHADLATRPPRIGLLPAFGYPPVSPIVTSRCSTRTTGGGEARPRERASTNLRQGVWSPNPYQVYEHAPQSTFKSQAPDMCEGSAEPFPARSDLSGLFTFNSTLVLMENQDDVRSRRRRVRENDPV